MKIGIVGGSFNPIHHGHLIMAEHLLNETDLEKIIFIPAGKAPHKKYDVEDFHRWNMLNLAISGNENFKACEYELDSDETSYTIKTLKYLNEKFINDQLYFIIGLDNLFHLEDWYKIEEYYKYTKIIVSNRRDCENSKLDVRYKLEELYNRFNLEIEVVETSLIEISSSEIREYRKIGKSINYLTPKKVVEYIEDNDLYK